MPGDPDCDDTAGHYKCPGYCCEAFAVGPADTMQERIEMMRRILPEDAEFVSKNFIPLPPQTTTENPTRRWRGGQVQPLPEPRAVYHTCKAFDRTTRTCTAYESRPLLCRLFPNREPCQFEGCAHGPTLNPERTP